MKAINSIWIFSLIVAGSLLIFTANCKKNEDSTSSASVTDADGNIYSTVTIGKQIWMKENLKVTKYNDGTATPLVTEIETWAALSTPGCCWYNNDITNKGTYGLLYNWFVVDSASNGGKNVCPTGWHVPTNVEWIKLTTHLGGEDIAGRKLKEAGSTHWGGLNEGASNSSGFTALPGGCRVNFESIYGDGGYNGIGGFGGWWSSTEYTEPEFGPVFPAYYRGMYSIYSDVSVNVYSKQYGFSVRCLKDN